MRIYLVRHGQTDWNKEYIIQGRINKQLNENGKEQAKNKSQELLNIKFTKAFSSSLDRAYDTAKIILDNINQSELKITKFYELVERDFGELEGMKINTEISQMFKEQDLSAVKGYETDTQLESRISKFINLLPSISNEDDVILITAHAHVNKCILSLLFPDQFKYNYIMENLEINIIDFKNKEFEYKGKL